LKSIGIIILVAVNIAARAADLPFLAWQGNTMGSTYTVKVVEASLNDKQLEELKTEVDLRLQEINRQMSHYQTNSELSRFALAPANRPFPISREFANVVRLAMDLNQRSQGAFDPTLGPVINLWGFGEKTEIRKTPPEAEVKKALALTGCWHLTISANNELIKDIDGLQLNLGAIAKGFGTAEMGRVLRAHGLTNYYVSISGEVLTSGHNPNGQKWQVGISAPVSNWRDGDPLVAVLGVSGQAVSTSGDYQKFFLDENDRRLCHIFDAKTGHPVQHNLGSVTIVAGNGLLADGLATSTFILGPDAGLRFIEGYTNAAALFIIREAEGQFRQVLSSRFTDMTGYSLTPPKD
jgi:FAD:protein FMN transferase